MSARLNSRRWVSILSATCALVASACGGAESTTPPAQVCSVSSVSVSAPVSTILPGASTTLSANASTSNCTTTPATTWSSNAPTVAIVSATGTVTGVLAGTAVITATIGGMSGTATITVGAAAVNTVEIAANSGSVIVGQAMTLVATTKDVQGATLTGRTIAWSSSNASIATVQSNGLVGGIAAGTATITATSEGKSGSVTITVSSVPVSTVDVTILSNTVAPNATQQASAVLRDAAGQVLGGRAVAWSSSNAAVATVSAVGLVGGVAPGTATITATSEGKSGSTVVTVQVPAVPVATVTVTVPSTTMALNVSQQATAVTRDALGNVLTGRTIAWSSSNAVVGTVQASGLVASIAPGVVAITATVEGKAGSVAITVPVPPAPTLASVSPLAVDAVFATMPISVTGTNFMSYASTMTFTGTGITSSGFTVNTPTSITAQMNIAGGTATTVSNVSNTNFGGTSNSRAITVYAVGTATEDGAPTVGTPPVTWTGFDCPAGSVATGANVRMGAFLDQYATRCQSVTGAARTFGAVTATSSVGGNGGLPFTVACGAGTVMTGISGTYTNASVLNIVTLAAICSPIAGGATSTTTAAGGAPGAATYSASCPAGLVVTGMQGGSGTLVEAVVLHCR